MSDIHFDFEAALAALTMISGLIWLIWIIVNRGNRRADGSQPKVVEYAQSFFPVLFAVLLVRSFLGEPFRIPSSSMMPTLLIGDFIVVNKFAYGLKLPVVHTKVMPVGAPERGDVVVFRLPDDPSIDYIKRIVGLPGDVIEYRNKTVYINGEAAELEPLGAFFGEGQSAPMNGMLQVKEHLPGRPHEILLLPRGPNQVARWEVPQGEYFVLGDNRDNSKDSRYWGFVPERNLVGKALAVWMHWDPSNGFIGFHRIGEKIQ